MTPHHAVPVRWLAYAALVSLAGPCTAAAQARFRNSYDSVRVSSSYSVLTAVESPSGTFAVSGGDGGNGYLIELDSNGATNFFKTYDLYSAPALDVIPGGGYVLAGERLSNDDPAILRVDANGDLLWAASYDVGYSEQGFYVVHPTADGGYLLSGIFTLKVDGSGNTVWSKIHIGGGGNVNGTAITPDGGAVLTGEGQYGSVAPLGYNAVVTRMDAAGTISWNKVFGGDDYDWAAAVTPTSDAGYAVTGWTRSFAGGNQACFLIKLDASGVLLWANTYAGVARSQCQSVRQARDDGYILTGSLDGILVLVKTDPMGAFDWARTYGLSGSIGYSVAQTADDGYVVAGSANSNLTIVKTDASGDADTCDQTDVSVTVTSAPFLTASNSTGSAQIWTKADRMPTVTTSTPTGRTCGVGCAAIAMAQASSSEICEGGTVTLTALGSSIDRCNVAPEYRFRAPGFLRDWSTVATATDTPPTARTYTIDIRCSDPGCQASSAPLTIIVHPNPLLDAGPDRTICLSQTTMLGATPTATAGTPPYTYDWVAVPPDPSMSCSSGMLCANPMVSPTATTTYSLTVNDFAGCSDATQVAVTVDVPSPPPDHGNAMFLIKGTSDPVDLVFTWPLVGGSAVADNLRSSDNRDFAPPNDVRLTLAPTTGTTLTGEVPPPSVPRLYRVTTNNCAGDESWF